MWKSLNMGAALSAVLLFAVAACNQAPPPPRVKGPSPASQAWDKLTKGFIEDYMLAQPAFAAQAGRHEFDGQLPDVSAHGIKREISRLHEARNQIAAVDPAALEPRERFDRDYLLRSDRQRPLLDRKDQVSVQQSGLLHRPNRSGHVLQPKLCAAGSAHEGLHQVRARHPQDGEPDQGQSEIAHAEDLRRVGHRAIRRPR